jgi:hypothetical protein
MCRLGPGGKRSKFAFLATLERFTAIARSARRISIEHFRDGPKVTAIDPCAMHAGIPFSANESHTGFIRPAPFRRC